MRIKQNLNQDIYSGYEDSIELTDAGLVKIILSGNEYTVTKYINKDNLIAFMQQLKVAQSKEEL